MSNGKPKIKKINRSEGGTLDYQRSMLKPLNYQANVSGLSLYNYKNPSYLNHS